MVEKILEVQGSMTLGFVDLEKAFDTVPREMVMATLRWMGVPAAEVRMVEGMHEKTTARVVVREGASEGFEVKIGLRHGSVLSPLPCLRPILTAKAPSSTTTLAVFSYMPSTILTFASGIPIHCSVAITISLGTVSKAVCRSTNPTVPPISSLPSVSQDVHRKHTEVVLTT